MPKMKTTIYVPKNKAVAALEKLENIGNATVRANFEKDEPTSIQIEFTKVTDLVAIRDVSREFNDGDPVKPRV